MQSLLTAAQVSKLLTVSKPTIYRLAEQGILPAVIVARRSRKTLLRFRQETVEKFVREREERGGTNKRKR